jgi:hypothetical protein
VISGNAQDFIGKRKKAGAHKDGHIIKQIKKLNETGKNGYTSTGERD